MLAVVKTPRINEIMINGKDAENILSLLRSRYTVAVISPDHEEVLVDANTTEYARKNAWRVLKGYRLKAGLTQRDVAEKTGIRQSVISEYERAKRQITMAAALKLAAALNTTPESLLFLSR